MKTSLYAGILLLASVPASAALVTKMGTDVSFTYDDATLFGAGKVVGNSITFLTEPGDPEFKAESTDDDGAVLTSATLNIQVKVKPGSAGFEITDIAVLEKGDYLLTPAVGSSAVSVDARLQLTSNTTNCGFFACQTVEIFTPGPLTVRNALTNWSAGTLLGVSNDDGWDADTDLSVQLQNNLHAVSTIIGESALVQKKSGQVGIVINPVIPIPGAVWLFGSALGLLGWFRGRRAKLSS